MIGVLGGTFDPVHFGHLRPALELYEMLGLDQLRMIPCGIPPHRDLPRASGAQRLAMLQLALTDEPGLVIDQRELQRPGPSYMVDTLISLREELGGVPLALIIGMDAFHGLERWHRWRELVDLCHLIVAHRPGWLAPAEGELAALLAARQVGDAAALRGRPAGGVGFCAVTQLDISASRIRELVRVGQSPRFLLPDPVLDYITTAGLYRD